uniref:Cysteine-rich venom protein n=1 Tax=Scolopendra mojiangica (nomen nudum) TaxID=2023220 RepID=A0A5B9CTU5_9MYRI|nr:venom allergen [Scolopendra mojiangica (nomen nudum)]QEE04223.1 venom allergen [Scolopendra mojiangica (nomen nudum)]
MLYTVPFFVFVFSQILQGGMPQSTGAFIGRTSQQIPNNFTFGRKLPVELPAKTQPYSAMVKSETCNILFSGLNDDQKKEIVNLHNKLRQKVASGNQPKQPSAINMNQLHWDNDLAHYAQILANRCVAKHNSPTLKKYRSVGQNIGAGWSSFSEKTPKFKSFIDGWYDEVKDFDSKKIQPFMYSTVYGHYTQVVWARTQAVGCGFTAFRDDKGVFNKIFVCNYGPGGNYPGSSVYLSGKSCSNCKKGCSKQFPSLCNV